MSAVDGLIVGGGDDIGPELYEGEIVTSARLDPERDAELVTVADLVAAVSSARAG